MLTVDQEVQRALTAGATRSAGWRGESRMVELNTLQEGDVLVFPTKDKGFEVFDDNRFKDRNDNPTQFIVVPTEKGEARRIYASTFSKTRQIWEEIGGTIRPTGQTAKVSGDIIDKMQAKQGTLTDQMNELLDKKILVEKVMTYKTRRFGTNELQNATFPIFKDVTNKK